MIAFIIEGHEFLMKSTKTFLAMPSFSVVSPACTFEAKKALNTINNVICFFINFLAVNLQS